MTNYKVLPSEPTDKMINNGANELKQQLVALSYGGNLQHIALKVHEAMYASAPQVECEPILYAVKDYIEACKLHNGKTLCSLYKTDIHVMPLYTTPPDTQAKITELEAKLKFTDDLKLGELKRINVQLQGKVEELEAKNAKLIAMLIDIRTKTTDLHEDENAYVTRRRVADIRLLSDLALNK